MGGQVSLALAFGAGVASFVSPCVLPVVPGYVGYVTGKSLDDSRTGGTPVSRAHVAVHAGLFVLGFALLFIALGISATAVGGAARRALPLIRQLGGAVIVLFGLYLLGLLKLPLLMQEWRVQLAAKPAGLAGSLLAGIAFGAGWTPCVGPVLATILLYAGLAGSAMHGAALLGTYALGLGLPFFVAAIALDGFLLRTRWLRRWLLPIERASGAVMVVAGALLFTGRLSSLSGWFAP